jgi:hypothetical protein
LADDVAIEFGDDAARGQSGERGFHTRRFNGNP